jgi:phosphatidylserine/phosphatidylglycerophosphate/cardiolipin synthase-like enzyme
VMRPPFDHAEAQLFTTSDVLVTFADRHKATGPVRPARYEGASVWLTRIEPAGSSLELHWPATCAAKTVDLQAGSPVPHLLELSVMPFLVGEALRDIPGGVPTFYLGYDNVPPPDDHDGVRPGDPAIPIQGAWLGIMFQDRMTLAPWAWFDRIAAVPGADPGWAQWADAYTARRRLRLLDAQGRPYAGQTIRVTTGSQVSSVVSDDAGELNGLALQGTLSWEPAPAGQPRPVMAMLDTDLSNRPGENGLVLPAGFGGGHLQLAELSNWLAPYLHEDPTSELPGARFRTGSLMEPLVDGEETYALLMTDLRAAIGQGGAAYFAGWAFKDFPFLPPDEATRLVNIAKTIEVAGGQVKILAAQFLQASDQVLNTLSADAGLVLLTLVGIGGPLALITRVTGHTDDIGLGVWALLASGALILYAVKLSEGEDIATALRGSAEQTSPEFLARLAAVCDARYSPHPVSMDDNPLAEDIPLPLPSGNSLRDLQDRWGIFHQKMQLVKKVEPGPERYSAYVGGIDVHRNRLDSPGHNGMRWIEPDSTEEPGPGCFHDVHCRLTGPAVGEVFHVFKGRDEVHLTDAEIAARPAKDVPVVPMLADLPPRGRDIIQVAQTSFKPAPGRQGFRWAPQGNATTHNTFVNAIRAAREHIYIEEQYMVPSDPYMEALIEAAEHCERLIILLPSYLEVYFGDRKRGNFFKDLELAWGKRLFIGTPMRRPILDPPGRITSKGRLTLLADVGGGASSLLVGPPTRVPSGRFFLWANGELMYVTGAIDAAGPNGQAAKELSVLRGGNGTAQRWCENPRPHEKGTALTAAQPIPIFLHCKIMMVDDVFVAIGSTNINRRGFFHDGEITAFAIPEELRNADHNPARDLRTRLWGEQLGLTPQLGATLFRDPIAGFELFKRSRYQGNRVIPLNELAVPVPTLNDLPELIEQLPAAVSNFIQLTLQVALEPLGERIFNTVSDPTTTLENQP